MGRPALLLLVALVGCAGAPAHHGGNPFGTGLWPLYTADRRPFAGVSERRALGPLLHWEASEAHHATPGDRRFELRPLYSTIRLDGAARHDLLYPLSAWSRSERRTRAWLLWLARHRSDAESDARQTILGIAYRGITADGSRYGGLFPILGRFSGRFGFDRIRFVLWPLWARGERGEYRETQLLWPFFAWGRGDGRFKLRLWPLWGTERRDDVERRSFFLWPFVHRRETRLDTATPERSFLVLPLYGRRDRGALHMRFYLFPLLARQWNAAHPDVHRTDALWPFFMAERDVRGGVRRVLRPLVDVRRSPLGHAWSVGLGLLGHAWRGEEGAELDRWRVLWAGQLARGRAEGVDVRRVDLWPLVRFAERTGPDGERAGFVRAPYLIPFRGLEPDGWDRHYNKLFELYGARWLGDERRESVLFGLRESRTSTTESWVSWGGLLHLRR